MAELGVKFAYPPGLTKQSTIQNPGQQFKAVINIRRADLNGEKAWAVLELEAERKDAESGIAQVTGKAARVDSVIQDIVEG
jgi:hypothetical protein